MIVVIDCNVLVMCLTSRSNYHLIYQALTKQQYELIATTDILLEYEEIIQTKYNIKTADSFLALLNELPNVTFINTYYRWMLIDADPDDNKYCDVAIAGKADYIVSEDKHFNVLKTIAFPRLIVITIDSFMNMLKKLP